MSLEKITSEIQKKLSLSAPIEARIKLDFGEDGCVLVDATQNPPVVSNADEDADTVLSCSMDVFKGIVEGTQDPTMAYMMGKLKVQGNMGLAMKLNSLLED
ncbi:MAG: SCP-2 sterol transfer family protein [Alphaproteobacteria bacterium]|nr:SCP-2 sterol transfer family protein [Alphaproteobacteria bacterium]HCQ70604.1 SCP-2 sterol transfer family protein [Rhodospirillaceae bacterium]|tara:strand:+ start:47902 stop:48204 length:303 start_codon:yes stop_codon:yes gene_type:complete